MDQYIPQDIVDAYSTRKTDDTKSQLYLQK